MEAFGLFHLLQSLLPKAEERAEQASEEEASTALQPAPKSTENGVKNDAETPMQNACLDFLARHDERVKNVRKK